MLHDLEHASSCAFCSLLVSLSQCCLIGEGRDFKYGASTWQLEACPYLEATDCCSLLLAPTEILNLQNSWFKPGKIESSSRCYCYKFFFNSVLCVFSQGFLETTSLFYGYYEIDAALLRGVRYNFPLAYLLTTFAYLALSLVWIIKR